MKLCYLQADKQRWKGELRGHPTLEMKLFVELGRNKTVVDEQGFVIEDRSLHMKRIDCGEIQNLKKAGKKKSKVPK